jgi:hypothetical protein
LSYLPPPSTRATFGLRRLGAHSAQGARLGAIKKFRRFSLRGLSSLSNGSTTPTCAAVDPATGVIYGQEGVFCTPTLAPQGPTASDIGNPLTVAGAPGSALQYVSPQAAIAAGLDPTSVMNEWTQALAVFPTAQDAINAGVPAGVVTQLFVASRAFANKPKQPPVWPLLAAAAIGALLVNAMDKGR